MKKKQVKKIAMFALFLILLNWNISSIAHTNIEFSVLIPGSCTIFTASIGGRVLFGNNEDYFNRHTYYWVEPWKNGKYGVVYLGTDDFFPQGAINEKGLAYDANGLPEVPLNRHPEFLSVPTEWLSNPKLAIEKIMEEASNVDEVISILTRYNFGDITGNQMGYQLMFADARGNAVVISAGLDGELAFTRKKKGERFLVSTNFNRANPNNGRYPCPRYRVATYNLGEMDFKNVLTVDHFKSILKFVSAEGPKVNTLYSNIFDLKNGDIYLYYWHQFDEVVKLNVSDLLVKGQQRGKISDLFSKQTVEKANREYLGYKENK